MPAPSTSYILWFTPRTGSNLLCDALASTGVAGTPSELLSSTRALNTAAVYGVAEGPELQQILWARGGGDVFGTKARMFEPHASTVRALLQSFAGDAAGAMDDAELWESAFPNCHHVMLTRRNKVRQAVSWFRATLTREWTREPGSPPPLAYGDDAYDKGAIQRLMLFATMSEAMMAEFFSSHGIVPHVVVYEDFVARFEPTVHALLRHLGLPHEGAVVGDPILDRLADEESERWVQRYRQDQQDGWLNRW